MYSEINKKLEEAQQKIHRLHKIDSMLNELKSDERLLSNKAYELKKLLDKENIDVEKLNKNSLSSIFYSLTGQLEDKKEKEQREAISAKLKYDQSIHDLENVKYEISKLIDEKKNYKDCINEYKGLYEQKKDLLIKSNEKSADKILDVTSKLENSKNNLKELKEAISAGRYVIRSLETSLESLSSAKGWGTWDLLGGGLISDLAKHSHIDEAMSEVEHAHNLLRNFKTELADVRINYDINFETEGFAKFADFFFDGLLSDWYMQSKIENTYESINKVKQQVERAIYNLNQLENQETLNIEKFEKELNDIILNS